MELTQLAILEKAQALGLEVNLLEGSGSDCIAVYQGDQEILFNSDGVPLHQFNYQAYSIAANKQLSKRFFEKLGLPHPKSIIFQDFTEDLAQIKAFFKEGDSYVCKPLNGMGGRGVCMDIQNLATLQEAWQDWNSEYEVFMLEEQKAGHDLRIQAVGGRMVAACRRLPAHVLGDGQQSLAQLIQHKQQAVKTQNPANQLDIDKTALQLIAQQQMTLESVPANQTQVWLKSVANMNQGASAIDITEEVHPDYRHWIEQIAAALQLRVFALDVLTLDYQSAPTPQNSWALEINGSPYWYHHTFSEKRQHDMAELILRDCFSL